MGHEAVELDEAPLVEQEVEPLARGELALLVLLRRCASAPPPCSASALAVVEVVEAFARVGHGGNVAAGGEAGSGRNERGAAMQERAHASWCAGSARSPLSPARLRRVLVRLSPRFVGGRLVEVAA